MRRPAASASSRPSLIRRACCPLAALVFVIPAERSLALEVHSSVSLTEVYSDNVFLAPSGSEQSDFVTLLEPSLVLTEQLRRLTLDVQYLAQLLYYKDASDSTQAFQQGRGRLGLEVLEEHLFLDSQVAYYQVLKNPTQQITFSSIPQIANRSNALEYQTAPRWHQVILDHTIDARYTIGKVDYSASNLQDVVYQYTDFDLKSPEKDRGLTWALHQEYQQFDYDLPPLLKRQLVDATLTYHFGGGLSIFGTGGAESDVQVHTSASLTDPLWRAGFRSESPKLVLSGWAGRRSFGSIIGGLLRANLNGGFIEASYDELPKTQEQLLNERQFPAVPGGPAVPPPATGQPGTGVTGEPTVLPPTIGQPGTGQLIIDRLGLLTVGKTFGHSNIELGAFHVQQFAADQAAATSGVSETKETGFSASFNYALGPKTDLGVRGWWSKREFTNQPGNTKSESRLLLGEASLAHRLGIHTSVRLFARHDQQSGSSDYHENLVGIALVRDLF